MKSSFISGILTLVLLISAGCSSSDEVTNDNLTRIIRSGSKPAQVDAQSSAYLMRQGDQVQLVVWGYSEFNTTATIKEGGLLTIPLIGDMLASGLSKQQFEDQLRKKLAEYIKGEIKLTLTVTSMVAQKVTVLGAVVRQENYPLSNDASVIEILSAAGGTTPESDLRHIKIIRNGINQPPVDVDLTAYMEYGLLESVPLIHPGDILYVPRKENVLREVSDFMRDAIFIFGFFRVFN